VIYSADATKLYAMILILFLIVYKKLDTK